MILVLGSRCTAASRPNVFPVEQIVMFEFAPCLNMLRKHCLHARAVYKHPPALFINMAFVLKVTSVFAALKRKLFGNRVAAHR